MTKLLTNWVVEDDNGLLDILVGIGPDAGTRIASVMIDEKAKDYANLISAAPDMFAALNAITDILAPWPMPGLRAEFDAALAAIAKAKGRAA